MTTVNSICERALRKLRIAAKDEPMQADDARHTCDALNAMLSALSIGESDAGHTPVNLSSEFSYPARLEEPIVLMLAARVAQDFGAEPPNASHAERLVEAWFFNPSNVQYPDELTQVPSQDRWAGYA